MRVANNVGTTATIGAWFTRGQLMLLFSVIIVITLIAYIAIYVDLSVIMVSRYEVQDYDDEDNETLLFSEGDIFLGGQCIIPKLDPFSEDIKEFMTPPQHIDCTTNNKHPLIFKSDLDSNIVTVQNPKQFGYDNCCYTPFIRGKSDRKEKFSNECYAINSTAVNVPPPHEFVAIYCLQAKSKSKKKKKESNQKKLVDMLHFVHPKPEADAKEHDSSHDTQDSLPMPNIVILGLDAVSHMNFIRMMPESYAYLTQNLSAIGFDGYSIFAENTFSNMVPMLIGVTRNELKDVCWKPGGAFFDDCPFLWKNFSRLGYTTSYAEDSTAMGIFLYAKNGFKRQPTDYYLVPLLDVMADKKLFHQGNSSIKSAGICYGPRMGIEILLGNIQKVLHTTMRRRPLFQFTWATSLAHGSHNLASAGDNALKDFLLWMNTNAQFNNTIFILMSDHGNKFGAFRQTSGQGRLEAKMPFLYFVLPEWFSTRYANAISNMKLNRDKLTTPLDLHQTLKDLLDLRQIENEQILKRDVDLKNSTMLPRSMSFFLQIPDTSRRKCQDAGITVNNCACTTHASLNATDEKVVQGTRKALRQINKQLAPYSNCAQLELDSVLYAYEIFNSTAELEQYDRVGESEDDDKVSSNLSGKGSKANFVMLVVFKTMPNNGIFEATLIEVGGKWITSGDIGRINKYGNQSRCVKDYRVKMYCYC